MAAPATQSISTVPANQPAPEYSVNERVLCFHGPLVYEAKILKMERHDVPCATTGMTGMHYLVHYKGWKQTWDELVPASRLLKMNEENLVKQKALQAQHNSASHGGAGSSSTTTKAHKSGTGAGTGGSVRTAVRKDGRGTKRGRDDDDSSRKPEMKLVVPEILKSKLVDDWEAVTKNNQLVSLPRSPTVVEILHEFSESILQIKPPNLREPEVLLPTIISGLQCYFDKSLGMNLLYRFERPQYAQIRKKYWTGQEVVVGVTEKEMSHIYGAEHLLRMIVSLPSMVTQTSLDPDSVGLIRDYVNELLQYLMKERDRLFQKEYENPGPGYINISRS